MYLLHLSKRLRFHQIIEIEKKSFYIHIHLFKHIIYVCIHIHFDLDVQLKSYPVSEPTVLMFLSWELDVGKHRPINYWLFPAPDHHNYIGH